MLTRLGLFLGLVVDGIPPGTPSAVLIGARISIYGPRSLKEPSFPLVDSLTASR
jgi:hypothetical protein